MTQCLHYFVVFLINSVQLHLVVDVVHLHLHNYYLYSSTVDALTFYTCRNPGDSRNILRIGRLFCVSARFALPIFYASVLALTEQYSELDAGQFFVPNPTHILELMSDS